MTAGFRIIPETSLQDICSLFQHTTGQKSSVADVLRFLERSDVIVERCFIQMHHILRIGLRDTEHHICNYVVMLHDLHSGNLTTEHIRQRLGKTDKVRSGDADKLTFKTLDGDVTDDTVTYIHELHVASKMRVYMKSNYNIHLSIGCSKQYNKSRQSSLGGCSSCCSLQDGNHRVGL